MVWRCKRRDAAASLFGSWLRRFCHNTTSPILLRQKKSQLYLNPCCFNKLSAQTASTLGKRGAGEVL